MNKIPRKTYTKTRASSASPIAPVTAPLLGGAMTSRTAPVTAAATNTDKHSSVVQNSARKSSVQSPLDLLANAASSMARDDNFSNITSACTSLRMDIINHDQNVKKRFEKLNAILNSLSAEERSLLANNIVNAQTPSTLPMNGSTNTFQQAASSIVALREQLVGCVSNIASTASKNATMESTSNLTASLSSLASALPHVGSGNVIASAANAAIAELGKRPCSLLVPNPDAAPRNTETVVEQPVRQQVLQNNAAPVVVPEASNRSVPPKLQPIKKVPSAQAVPPAPLQENQSNNSNNSNNNDTNNTNKPHPRLQITRCQYNWYKENCAAVTTTELSKDNYSTKMFANVRSDVFRKQREAGQVKVFAAVDPKDAYNPYKMLPENYDYTQDKQWWSSIEQLTFNMIKCPCCDHALPIYMQVGAPIEIINAEQFHARKAAGQGQNMMTVHEIHNQSLSCAKQLQENARVIPKQSNLPSFRSEVVRPYNDARSFVQQQQQQNASSYGPMHRRPLYQEARQAAAPYYSMFNRQPMPTAQNIEVLASTVKTGSLDLTQ